MATLLVVEDDEQVRTLAEFALQEGGHTTAGASGVESAKALIDSDQTFDVLFTDVELGTDSEGGLMVARYAREKDPNVKVIYTTGLGVNEGLRAAFVDGCEFIPKPYTPDQVMAVVGRLYPS